MKLSAKDIEFFYSIAADMFSGKDIPEWISEHPAIKGRKIKKVFPGAGLPNFKEKVELPAESMAPSFNSPLIASTVIGIQAQVISTEDIIKAAFRTFLDSTREKREKKDLKPEEKVIFYKELEILEKEKSNIVRMLEHFSNIVVDSDLVKGLPDGRAKLVVVEPIMLKDKNIAREGETIFKAYGKVKIIVDSYLDKLGFPTRMKALDSIPAVQEFNTKNVPMAKEDLYVVFSSSGEEGAWDIATMSMRGIRSCQMWESSVGEGTHRPCLIGSVASRYVGIIYLTSGKDFEGRGSKMIRRCIVRFGLDTSKGGNQPVIILDKMYDSHHPVIAGLFLNALKKRSKYPVIDVSAGVGSLENQEWEQNIKLPEEKLPEVYEKKPEGKEISPYNEPEYGLKSYRDTLFEYLEKGKEKEESIEVKYLKDLQRRDKIRENRSKLEIVSMKIYGIFHNILEKYKNNISENEFNEIDNSFFKNINHITTRILPRPPIGNRVLTKDFNFVKKFFLTKCLKIQIDTSELSQTTKELADKTLAEARNYIMAELEKTRAE